MFVDTVFWVIIIAVAALGVGLFLGRWLGRSQCNQELAKLTAANAVLEDRLQQQHQHFDAQLKLVEDAKTSLGKEFENLANRIFDDKQNKFSQQSKEQLENSLSPLRRDIGEFRQQVSSAYEKENADRNKLVGQISELQKQTLQISADAVSLANALRGDNKHQGNWGEFVLEKLLEDAGLFISGLSPDGRLPEIVERKDHPFFIAVQFHPELKSKPFQPHPLFTEFVSAAGKHSRLV